MAGREWQTLLQPAPQCLPAVFGIEAPSLGDAVADPGSRRWRNAELTGALHALVTAALFCLRRQLAASLLTHGCLRVVWSRYLMNSGLQVAQWLLKVGLGPSQMRPQSFVSASLGDPGLGNPVRACV